MEGNGRAFGTDYGTGAYVSIGIIAWNEERAIRPMLTSVFDQSLFEQMAVRGQKVEIQCLVNGSTDKTAEIAAAVFRDQAASHEFANWFACRVLDIRQQGKLNAWNRFVHCSSAREAEFLFLMDADILLRTRTTLWNMLHSLEQNEAAKVCVDLPCKEIASKSRWSIIHRLSSSASTLTRSASAQLCGQLYCIRAWVARNIYLPRQLTACEDGFIKALVCTDFLTHPSRADRIIVAPDAAHSFEAYTNLGMVLRNQKRQAIGQTLVHVLIDQFLNRPVCANRERLADWLEEKDREDPDWLNRLVQNHLRKARYGWRLYPHLLTARFKVLARMPFPQKLLCFPAALVGSLIALITSMRAYAFLKAGLTPYWPRADRAGFDNAGQAHKSAAVPVKDSLQHG